MELHFSKMHGAGNDFIVINGIDQDVAHLTREDWQALAHRQLGIGADQILIVQRASRADVDFAYLIFNQDGSQVENCGNGARCFVRYVRDQGLTQSDEITVELCTGATMVLRLNPDDSVTVDMGAPNFEAASLPARIEGLATRRVAAETQVALELAGQTRWLSLVSMGNPHAVQVVEDVDTAPVVTEGALIEVAPMFPNRVNAGYISPMSGHEARVRVFERGAGETLACGTGICAAVVSAIRQDLLDSPVTV